MLRAARVPATGELFLEFPDRGPPRRQRLLLQAQQLLALLVAQVRRFVFAEGSPDLSSRTGGWGGGHWGGAPRNAPRVKVLGGGGGGWIAAKYIQRVTRFALVREMEWVELFPRRCSSVGGKADHAEAHGWKPSCW